VTASPGGKGKEAGEEEKLTKGRFCVFLGEEKQPAVGFDAEQELRWWRQWLPAARRTIPGGRRPTGSSGGAADVEDEVERLWA
jgi:hypothetical protein